MHVACNGDPKAEGDKVVSHPAPALFVTSIKPLSESLTTQKNVSFEISDEETEHFDLGLRGARRIGWKQFETTLIPKSYVT